jgi:tRNA threonylcarbamoyladenosine biosynthesis protein TsaB
MNLLSISTSGLQGSLAVNSKSQVKWDKKAMHSELATVKLQELLNQATVSLNDLSQLAVNVGPGSFTGIRVGVNLARTLAYSLGIKVAIFNSLELLAAKNLQIGQTGFVALKAVQNYFYSGTYRLERDGLVCLEEPASQVVLPNTLASQITPLIEGQTAGFSTLVEAIDLALWLERWPQSKSLFSWKDVKPLYIRGSEAEEKLRQGLLKPL